MRVTTAFNRFLKAIRDAIPTAEDMSIETARLAQRAVDQVRRDE